LSDEEKYKSLRNTLKSSARVKAKSDFEARLFARIKEAEKQPLQTEAFKKHPQVVQLTQPEKRGFMEILAGLFRPSFAPALGLTVVLLVAVVVYFGYFNKMNDQSPQNTSVSSDENKRDGFVIYVKKDSDGESYSDNYPKDISALTDGETTTSDSRTIAPGEVHSDFYAPRFDQPTTEDSPDREIKSDRVSEEQKIEMEREYLGKDGDVETRGYRKGDEIMKKESKTDSKVEGKIEPKKSTYKDEKSNQNINNESEENDGIIKQQVEEPAVDKANEQTDDSIDRDLDESTRISRAKSTDSLKAKDTNKINDQIQNQK
jgi:hypothetical protein